MRVERPERATRVGRDGHAVGQDRAEQRNGRGVEVDDVDLELERERETRGQIEEVDAGRADRDVDVRLGTMRPARARAEDERARDVSLPREQRAEPGDGGLVHVGMLKPPAMSAYGQYDADAEKRRLRLQAEVLEDLSDRALARLGPLDGLRALDVACGAMGLLGALSRRVGAGGRVVGCDVHEVMVEHARAFCREAGLANVDVVQDDIFASALPPQSFDLVHARFVLAPLGRDAELASAFERLVKPGGVVLLEEPDGFDTWRIFPDGAAHARLFAIIGKTFSHRMGGADAGQRLLRLASARGWTDVHFDAHVLALPPGHPYLEGPVMMATALRAAILKDTPADELDQAVAEAQAACERPGTYGVSFTLMQVWGRVPLR